MVICSHCNEIILSLTVLRHNTANHPVEQEIMPKYCPFCACRIILDDIPIKEYWRKDQY